MNTDQTTCVVVEPFGSEVQVARVPAKDHPHVAHVFLLLSASLAFTTAQPTTAHSNTHNSRHGSGAIVESVESW